jgi:hypothetical protein
MRAAPETVRAMKSTCTSYLKHLYHIRVRDFEFILVRGLAASRVNSYLYSLIPYWL